MKTSLGSLHLLQKMRLSSFHAWESVIITVAWIVYMPYHVEGFANGFFGDRSWMDENRKMFNNSSYRKELVSNLSMLKLDGSSDHRLEKKSLPLNKKISILEFAGSFISQGSIVKFTKFFWNKIWLIMMGELAPQDSSGSYIRPQYKNFNGVLGDSQHPIEPGRYHIYLGQACPWCHRVSLLLALRGIHSSDILTTYMRDDPEKASKGGWSFDVNYPDPIFGCKDLKEVYSLCSPDFAGKCTAPLLVDRKGGPEKKGSIVSNESKNIVRMINDAFAMGNDVNLYPKHLASKIDETNVWIYELINNGVYRAGFATSQIAHNNACKDIDEGLNRANDILKNSKFLNGEKVTESDIFFFPTAIRFDTVYATLFRCGGRRGQLCLYPHIDRWLKDVYFLKGVPETIDLEKVKNSYYKQLFPLNPSGIIPASPTIEDIVGDKKNIDESAFNFQNLFHIDNLE